MELSDSCESCKFHDGTRIDHMMQQEYKEIEEEIKSEESLRCGILSTRDKQGKSREEFIPKCPCRSCLVKMVCPYDYRMIFDKGTKCCYLFQEFMGEILEHYFKLWQDGKLKHVEQIHLGGHSY